MFTNIADEEMAHSAEMGALAHAAIGQLASLTLSPTAEQIRLTADRLLSRFRPIEARAHKQNLAGATGCYFWHLLPPRTFAFQGAEVALGPGRVDLLWADSAGRVLVDEIKTGHTRGLATARTMEQVQAYLVCGEAVWGSSFLGVRLLSTATPRLSRFATPSGRVVPLHGSGLVRGS